MNAHRIGFAVGFALLEALVAPGVAAIESNSDGPVSSEAAKSFTFNRVPPPSSGNRGLGALPGDQPGAAVAIPAYAPAGVSAPAQKAPAKPATEGSPAEIPYFDVATSKPVQMTTFKVTDLATQLYQDLHERFARQDYDRNLAPLYTSDITTDIRFAGTTVDRDASRRVSGISLIGISW